MAIFGAARTHIINQQSDTTNTVPVDIIQSGWGVGVPGAVSTFNETVTFPVAFSVLPIVVAICGGDATSAATYGSGANTIQLNISTKAHTITASSFIIHMTATAAWSAGNTLFYQWLAVGAP